jgi:hypothetical protein
MGQQLNGRVRPIPPQPDPEWRLTPQETNLFMWLATGARLTVGELRPLLIDPDSKGWRQRIGGIVSNTRIKLAPYGFVIKGDVSHGFGMAVAKPEPVPTEQDDAEEADPFRGQVVSLPSIGGMSYAYAAGRLYRDGEVVSVRARH